MHGFACNTVCSILSVFSTVFTFLQNSYLFPTSKSFCKFMLLQPFLMVVIVSCAVLMLAPLPPCWVSMSPPPHPTLSNTSCRPRNGSAVLFSLHAQSGDAGRLAVRVHVEIVRVDAPRHAGGPSEQAAHVMLSNVTPGARNAQEVRDPAGRVGVRGHTGSHRVAGHHTARDWRSGAAASDPGRVLDLWNKSLQIRNKSEANLKPVLAT